MAAKCSVPFSKTTSKRVLIDTCGLRTFSMLVLALKAIQSLKIAHRIQAPVENLSLPGVFCFYQLEGTVRRFHAKNSAKNKTVF